VNTTSQSQALSPGYAMTTIRPGGHRATCAGCGETFAAHCQSCGQCPRAGHTAECPEGQQRAACTSEDPNHPGLHCHLYAHPAEVAHYASGYRWAGLDTRPPARPEAPRCTTCHRSAHHPGSGWQGHPYTAEEGA
jgi:hypothetical protein